ncbi:hypothetical protein THRCLA_20390 [Thraustotheca clavata]|uniref:Uncharacterized protein n=1 Tax=Thraustotheca clavata TaxID=74557 RepID=A0A1W0A873_9STRA|nr:hypothetical protein THRCLA_20390 [Thraustotheca clavata]
MLLLFLATAAVHAQTCKTLTVVSKSSNEGTCDGSLGTHTWPLGVDASYCHGWSATDNDGNVFKYSASNLGCNSDNTAFVYTFYNSSIDCSTKGVGMNFTLSCARTPRNIFEKAESFDCCDRTSASFGNCNMTAPSISYPNSLKMSKLQVYENGALCSGSYSTEAPEAATKNGTAAPTTTAVTSSASNAVMTMATISIALVALMY